MPQFDSKTFNAEVFGRYVERIPSTKRNELIKSRALVVNDKLKDLFAPQTGAFKGTLPFFGRIGKNTQNYDGQTDITANGSETYSQTYVVVGRADAWTEKDFSADITGGVDFMDNVASQVAEYWDDVDTETLTSVLKGIFGITSGDFANKHTYDISNETDSKFGATTLNTALQKALGDNKSKFSLAIMHSVVATNLENLNLVERLKYTDKNGIQRDLTLGTLNGRLVLIDDEVPTQEVKSYKKTTDTSINAGKTYYTYANSKYTAVTSPSVDNISNYYEVENSYTVYTTYAFGDGAIEFCNVGAKTPYEMSRNAFTNGGEDTLVGRRRVVFAPHGVSFIGTPATQSPTNEELATAGNWEIVNNGKTGSAKKYIDHKLIPIARIITKG